MIDLYQEIWKIGANIIAQYSEMPHCEVCGSKMSDYRFIPFSPMKEFPVLLYQCPECQFISRNHSMLEDRIIREFYINLIMPHRVFHAELVNGNNKDGYADLLAFAPSPSVILDLGCGVGGLEYFAKDDGGKIKVISMDICKETTDYAATQGITVYPIDITKKEEIIAQMESLGIDKVDGIYCSNTIEHLKSPASVLGMWAELLKEGGFLYLVMPSLDKIFYERLVYEPAHLSYWTEGTFTKLINRKGLKVRMSQVFKEHNDAGTGSMRFVVVK